MVNNRLVSRNPAEAAAHLPDVLQFMQLLWALVHALERTSKRMSGDIGVTGPQRLVLRVVGLFPGLSAGDLAAILHVHPSTLTGVLQRLVEQRLLSRIDDPRDRRRAVLRLTPTGTRINRTGRGTVEWAVAKALDGVSDHDQAATRRVLSRLAEHLAPPESISPPSSAARRSRQQAASRHAGGPGSRADSRADARKHGQPRLNS